MHKWIFALSLVAQSVAYGWGAIGHETIGIIAENNLNPKVKVKVSELLNAQSLAQAGMWADKIKYIDSWMHTRPYHYVSIKPNMNYIENMKATDVATRNLGDIGRALLVAEDVLRNPKASTYDRSRALRFLIHFVADLHQPLHVGFVEDRGGNEIQVKWYGQSTNLHNVVDTYIIKTHLDKNNQAPLSPLSQPSEALANLLPTPSAKQIQLWQNSYVSDWINESIEGRSPLYAQASRANEAFYSNNMALVELRILQASYRLAAWLNAIFSESSYMPEKAQKMRSDILSVTNEPLEASISLKEKKTTQNFEAQMRHLDCDHIH